MDAKTQNDTLFACVPVRHKRIAGGASILAVGSDRGMSEERSTRLGAVLADLSPGERLGRFRNEIDGKLVFTTSFGLEDQVILHLLAELNIDVDIASASVEGESLAADGRYRRGRKRSVLFCSLGFPRPGEHNPHAPSGGNDCGRAAATIARSAVASDLAQSEGECRFAPTRCLRRAGRSSVFHAVSIAFF